MSLGGLSAREIALIRGALAGFPGVREAILCGSRAKGNASPSSDIDLAIVGDLDALQTVALAEDLEALPLPYTFDVRPLAGIRSRELLEHIERVGVPLLVGEGIGNDYR